MCKINCKSCYNLLNDKKRDINKTSCFKVQVVVGLSVKRIPQYMYISKSKGEVCYKMYVAVALTPVFCSGGHLTIAFSKCYIRNEGIGRGRRWTRICKAAGVACNVILVARGRFAILSYSFYR